MAKVLLKKSSVPSNAPGTGDLDYGEVALNYADGRLYYKNSSNQIKNFVDSDAMVALIAAGAAGITDVVQDLTPQLGGDLETNGNDITFGDNDKALFGAGSDLRIYHDGSNSYISDSGTGSLYIKSDGAGVAINGAGNSPMITALSGGAVFLNYNGSSKLTTTNTGVDVTGTIVGDGLEIDGNITVTGTVDGRDVAADGTKLDGIEVNAKDDQTITAGAGLTGGGTGDVTLNIGAGTGIKVSADAVSIDSAEIVNYQIPIHNLFSAAGDLSYSNGEFSFSETYSSASELLTAIKTVDGASSGLDADLLDGQHGSYYRIDVYDASGTLLN